MAVAALPKKSKPAPRPKPGSSDDLAWLKDALVALAPGQTLRVDGVTWDQYERILDVRDLSRRKAKISYDTGELEVMTRSNTHEQLKRILGDVIHTTSVVVGVPFQAMGETTVRRRDLEAGFEPDEWFYCGRNAVDFVGVEQIDFSVHPSPDLAVEIEISRSLMPRLKLYASIGVVEIWRCGPSHFEILQLDAKRHSYVAVARSRFLPMLSPMDVLRFTNMADTMHSSAVLAEVIEWARALSKSKHPT